MPLTITLKQLEKNLGLKLKTNAYCVGFDTASTTGVCFIYTTMESATIDWEIFKLPVLPRKIANEMDKAAKYESILDFMVMAVRDVKKKARVVDGGILVLEQSFLKMNVVAFGLLRALQGVCYSELYDCFTEIKVWLPGVVRKMVGFKSNLPKGTETKSRKAEIVLWVNNVLGSKLTDDNHADATILALAGILKE